MGIGESCSISNAELEEYLLIVKMVGVSCLKSMGGYKLAANSVGICIWHVYFGHWDGMASGIFCGLVLVLGDEQVLPY